MWAMSEPVTSVERRKHPRAQLKLPARIRWPGPLGMRLETTQTVDASRDGMLFHRHERCDKMARVWVAFPFDPAAGTSTQPETPARIVRVERGAGGGYWVGLRFESTPRTAKPPSTEERRGSQRIPFALPIFVRLAGTPWPEEFMTQDVSQHGVRFETSHIYALGDKVLSMIPWGEWSKTGEVAGRVVRVEPIENAHGPAPIENLEACKHALIASVAVEWSRTGKL
jgi:PilZ domain